MDRLRISLLTSLILVSWAVAPAAWAQAIDIPMIVTGSHEQNTWVSAAVAHQVETGIDDSGEFARTNYQLVAGRRFELTDDLFLVGNGAYQGTVYNFDDSKPEGFRWADIHRGTAMLGMGWTSGDWTVIGLAMARTDGESGSDFDDTLSGGGGLVVEYRWSETLRTGVVIGAMSQLEDDFGIIPIPTVDWRFSDGWLLHFGVVSAAGYPGIGPEISYQAKYWNFGLSGSYQKRRYRLRDRPGKAIDEGIGEETSFPLMARIGYRATENFSLALNGGMALGGEIRSGRRSGQRINKEDYDPTPIVGANFNFQW